MYEGNFNSYLWFEKRHYELSDFIELANQYFMDKYIAVVACDGSPYIQTQIEIDAGWYLKNNILYTSKITNPDLLPHHESYNEWFIFERLTEFAVEKSHVNYHIYLHNPEVLLDNFQPTWDLKATKTEIENVKEEQELFFKQIEIISPLFFLMDHDEFIFICRDKLMFENIFNKVSKKA